MARLVLAAGSRVLVELRATGLLRGLAHDPTLSAVAEPASLDIGEGSAVDAPVSVGFRADRVEPPATLRAGDREKMRANIVGQDVLDASRWPDIGFAGRYRGTLEHGRVEGTLSIRGGRSPVGFDVDVTREGETFTPRGVWEGRLTSLGVRPYKALLGMIQLEDWARLRLDVRFLLESRGK